MAVDADLIRTQKRTAFIVQRDEVTPTPFKATMEWCHSARDADHVRVMEEAGAPEEIIGDLRDLSVKLVMPDGEWVVRFQALEHCVEWLRAKRALEN